MGPLQIQSLYTLSINTLNIIFQIRLMNYTYLFSSYNSLLFPPFSIVQLLPLIILGFPPICLFHCQITEIYKLWNPLAYWSKPIFFSPAVRLLRMHLIYSVSYHSLPAILLMPFSCLSFSLSFHPTFAFVHAPLFLIR